MKKTNSILVLLFVALFLIIVGEPVFSDSDTIYISSVEDLHQLAQDASLDQWSVGKTVMLENDIDLEGEDFTPIPIFAGNFDGNGYTIKGLHITAEGSNIGLFRYLEEGGVIKNLHVEGTITLSGDRANVGGIVGYNKGTLENVGFSGIIESRETVGGLVGFNGDSGIIRDASFDGTIDGESKVGGITGYNAGSVAGSINKSNVNAKSDTSASIDVGGIAGFNIGIIDDSENTGNIGNPSIGENIGGIVGRQRGYITDANNYGTIYGQKEVGGIAGKLEPHVQLIIPPSKLDALEDEMETLDTAITKMIGNTRSNSNAIDTHLSQIQGGIHRSRRKIQSFVDGAAQGEEADNTAIIETMEDLLPIMDDMTSINPQGNDLADDMEDVREQVSNVTDLMMGIIEELSAGELRLEDIVIDVSREKVNQNNEGTLTGCKNFGDIEGEQNVGGIAGSMAFDFAMDLEEDFNIEEVLTIDTILEIRAIIVEAENVGNVTSTNNNVGGIVGNMTFGYIHGATSTGKIESLHGDYVGGIAGNSHGSIDSSYVKSPLKGRDYIGGVAGYGREITDAYTLVQIDRFNGYVGAIAGDISEDSVIEGNYFVSDILGGIDGISYGGHAEPIEHEALIANEDIPPIFETFLLTFRRNDMVVKAIKFEYGSAIAQEDMPNIPPRIERYGRWEDFDHRNLVFDTEVNAEYMPYLTSIESQEKRDSDVPIAMVEGKFTDEDTLTLTKNENPQSDEQQPIEQWQLTIPDNGQDKNVIMYHPPEGYRYLDIYVLSDDHWIKTNTRWEGEHMLFETSESNVVFRLVEGQPIIGYLILSFILVFIVVLFVVKIYGKWELARKRKKAGEKS